MEYEVRHVRPDEHRLLEDFFYEAIYVPEGFEGEVPRSIIYDDPKCRAAFEDFGSRLDDCALVAVVAGKVVGACWVRTTDEYGHIDDGIPSFSIGGHGRNHESNECGRKTMANAYCGLCDCRRGDNGGRCAFLRGLFRAAATYGIGFTRCLRNCCCEGI